jgi:hypothetical protein
MVKDATEIQALREAVDLTAEALNEAFRAAAPGMTENDLAAILKYTFNRRGTKESFLQAASGPNSTNVHFGATSRVLEAGDLVVFDVGAYVRGYTSDISRTIPVSGRFTKPQRAIYELVLAAQKEGCRRLVPGVDVQGRPGRGREDPHGRARQAGPCDRRAKARGRGASTSSTGSGTASGSTSTTAGPGTALALPRWPWRRGWS